MPDPVVPPADTIRRAIWHSETCRREPGCDCGYCAANDALDALLAVGERDRRQIARLAEAIEDYILWEPGKAGHAEAHRRLRAVLAGEEDAAEKREYRVTWQREGQTGKRRVLYQTLAGALRCSDRQATARDEMGWLRDGDGIEAPVRDERPEPIIFGPTIEVRTVGQWRAAGEGDTRP